MTPHIVTEVIAAACPWLILTIGLQRATSLVRSTITGWGLLLLAGAAAAGLLLLPVDGQVSARWVAGFSAGFSFPLIALLAVTAWERAFTRPVFREQDWVAGATFGATGGLALYPMALGIGGVDPYEWGWHFSPLFLVIGALTAWLCWRGNRFGWLLLLAVAAFHLRLLESENYWDYMLDPVYCFVSFIWLGKWAVQRTRRGSRLPRGAP